MTIRRLGTLGYGLYGSQAYIETMPSRDSDGNGFATDRLITWCETYGHLPAAQWIERNLRGRSPALATTTLSAQLYGAVAGLGLAVLPHFLARQGKLICLAANLGIDQEIWLAIHSDVAQSRRVQVVGEYVAGLIRGLRNEFETPPEHQPMRKTKR